MAIIEDPPSTKKTFKIEADAKHRNRPRIISAVGAASMAGRTMDVTTIACCANLVNEIPGFKAHGTLAPANARYTRRQTIGGGKGLGRREPCRAAEKTEIAARTGQNILGAVLASAPASTASLEVGL